jgi:hypothetical protein
MTTQKDGTKEMNAALTPQTDPWSFHRIIPEEPSMASVIAIRGSGHRPRHLQVVRPTTRTTGGWQRPLPAAVYRRRRLAAAVAVLLLTFVAGAVFSVVALSSPAGGTLTPAAEDARRVEYVVQPGDTLWGVAGEVAPDEDRREVVDAIAQDRGTSTLVPGDVVVWPPRGH